MANQAAKKSEARSRDFRKTHGYVILGVSLLYALVRFLILGSGWTRWHSWAFGSSVVVYWICYSTILGHIDSGGKIDDQVTMVEMSRDTLYLLLFSQTASLASDYAWLLMLIVPAIMTYKFLVGIVFPYILGGNQPEEPEIVLSKTQAKKQRLMEKRGGGR